MWKSKYDHEEQNENIQNSSYINPKIIKLVMCSKDNNNMCNKDTNNKIGLT